MKAYSIYIHAYIAKVPSGDSSILTSPSVQLCSSPLVGWEDATDDLNGLLLFMYIARMPHSCMHMCYSESCNMT